MRTLRSPFWLTEGFTAGCGCDSIFIITIIPVFSQKASQLAVTTTSQRATHGHFSGVRALCRLGGECSGFKELLAALEELDIRSGFVLSWKLPDAGRPACFGNCPPDLPLEPERVLII